MTLAKWDVSSGRGGCRLSTLASVMEKNRGKRGRKPVLLMPSATILQHQNGPKRNQKETKGAVVRANEVVWDVLEELLGVHQQQNTE